MPISSSPLVRRARRVSWAALAALLLAPRAARAQGGFMLQGIADAEVWKTGGRSYLLGRNDDRAGTLGRVQLWTAAEPWAGLVVFAEGQVETGPGRDEPGTEYYLDQFGIRWAPSGSAVLDVGKMPSPVGTFAARRFSDRNPLIGVPDGYPVSYPYGAQLSGTRGRADYRAAVVTLPIFHEGYAPDPSSAPRPALGGGVTLATGVRVGASATWGPYLGDESSPLLAAGTGWRAPRQRVAALDAQVSRGYVELRGEWARASYDVPNGATARGVTWYGEAKYTVLPRLYLATRVERNDYPVIGAVESPGAAAAWSAPNFDVYDGEVGAGFRVGPTTLLKASVRVDHVVPNAFVPAGAPRGSAVAVQLSQGFDVMGLVRRKL